MSRPGENPRAPVSLLWAGPDRAEAIAALHAGLFPEAWDAASITRLLDRPGATSFTAEAGQPRAAVGFILGQLAADEAEILSVGVASRFQRQGIGRQLVEGLGRAAKRAEARRLFLEVAADNTPALALYRKLGFAESGRRKGYYQRLGGAPAVDALVLALAL